MSGYYFSNCLTFCFCNSKKALNNPKEFIRSYCLVNCIFGFLTALCPFFNIYYIALANFTLSAAARLLITMDMPGNAQLVKFMVLGTFFLNLCCMALSGTLAMVLFVFTVGIGALTHVFEELAKENQDFAVVFKYISGFTTYGSVTIGVAWLFVFWQWMIISIQACKVCSTMGKASEIANKGYQVVMTDQYADMNNLNAKDQYYSDPLAMPVPVTFEEEIYFNNPLSCCCCDSKKYPNDPRAYIRAYFLVNIFFGCVGSADAFLGVYYFGFANLLCSLLGFFMVKSRSPGMASKV